MDLCLTPTFWSGTVALPPSKSIAHRVMIASYLAGKLPEETAELCTDLQTTARALHALDRGATVDCGASGTTLRLLLPLMMHFGVPHFRAEPRLMERPMPPYAAIARDGDGWTVQNRLTAGRYAFAGDRSSQFVSGLLFALPLLSGDSQITLTAPLVSAPYVTMTEAVLARFGITSERTGDTWRISGGQVYRPADVAIERDWSAAALYTVANTLGSRVAMPSLPRPSLQGDSAVERLSADLPTQIDASDIPDLVPLLAVQSALTDGQTTVFTGVGRLRGKESDRLAAVTSALCALGASAESADDTLRVRGQKTLSGGTVDACGDHRIAMLAALAATRSLASVTVLGADCIEKSYPRLWNDLRSLGMAVKEVR